MNATAGIQIGTEGSAEIAGTNDAAAVPMMQADARGGPADSNSTAPHNSTVHARSDFKSLIEALGVSPQSAACGSFASSYAPPLPAQENDRNSTLAVLRGPAEGGASKASNGGVRALPGSSSPVSKSVSAAKTHGDSSDARKVSNRGGMPALEEKPAAESPIAVSAHNGMPAFGPPIPTLLTGQIGSAFTPEPVAVANDAFSGGVPRDAALERPAMKAMAPSAGMDPSEPAGALRDFATSAPVVLHDSAPPPCQKEAESSDSLAAGHDRPLPSGADPTLDATPEDRLSSVLRAAGPAGELNATAVPDPISSPDPVRDHPGTRFAASARAAYPSSAIAVSRVSGRALERGTKAPSGGSGSAGVVSANALVAALNNVSPSQPGGSVNAGEKPTAASPRTVAGAVDPFAALDGEGTNPPATWIHTGAHHAEAGYLDPALGWVRIRADSTSGAVHAALVPASAEAAQVLGGHIAGLNAYLSEQHGNSPSVTLAAPQNDGTAMTMGRDSGDQPPSQQQERPRGRENTIVMPSLAVIPVRAAPDQGMMSAYPSPAAGKTISVVA